MFFRYIVYASAFILCIQALPVEEKSNTKKDFKGFKHLGSLKRNGPDGTIMESEYYYHHGPTSWGYSSLDCIRIGTTLLSIEDEVEDMFIRDLLFAEGLTEGVWSSGNYVEEEDKWKWMSDPITYFNFKESLPPTNSTYYNILANGTPGNYGWSTAFSSSKYEYICEKVL